MPDPQITISIVSWNSAGQLPECLDSIKAQKNVATETIVIDNNSPDETAKMISAQYPWVSLIENPENVGFGRAHNIACDKARGEWLLILNPDTVLPPDTLSRLLGAARSTKADLLAPQLRFASGGLQRSAHRKWPSMYSHLYLYNFLFFAVMQKLRPGYDPTLYSEQEHTKKLRPKHVMGAAMLMRRDKFISLGGFDPSFFLYLEETDLCHRLKEMGGDIVYDPDIFITHLLGGSTGETTLGQASPHYLRSSYLYAKKYHGAVYEAVMRGLTISSLAINLVILSVLTLVIKRRGIKMGLDLTQRAFKWHMEG